MRVRLSLGRVLEEFGIGRSLVLAFLRRGGAVRPPAACSFDEGMETLPRSLHAANLTNIRLHAAVESLTRAGGRWQISWSGGTAVADHVVITAPSGPAARILHGEIPATASALDSLRYNPLAVVHLHAEEKGPRGLGYQVSLAERLATRGVTFNDSLFGRRGVYTAYLGGAKAPEVVRWSDVEISTVAAREFAAATGLAARPLSVARESMPAWDVSWAALDRLALPAGLHLAASWESRPGIPGRLEQARRLARELSARA
jgi:oxygen-dependent protoporphyrinogen oxidase